MYEEHPVFKSPNNKNIAIWRYLDFTKFVSLIDTKSLFFIRADKLNDPFEGSYPQANVQLRPSLYGGSIPGEKLEDISNFYRAIRKYTVINSWHINEYESAAMWELYLKSNEGIAIQSTFNRLKDSFVGNKENKVHIGKVNYIDYETEWLPEGNAFYPFVHKRKSFEHERELRAIVQSIPTKEGKMDLSQDVISTGTNIPVDLDTLVEGIYVSPTSPKWFFSLVTSIGKKYKLEKKIFSSSLADDRPMY